MPLGDLIAILLALAVLMALRKMKGDIMDELERLTTAVRTYIAKNKQRDADVDARIRNAVASALADDEIKDNAKAKALADEVIAAMDDNPAVEPPVIEPSNL